MSIPKQLLVAAIAAVAGLTGLGAFWLMTTAIADGAQAGYREVAIGTLVYATVYVLIVPRAERWVGQAGGAVPQQTI